MSYRKWRLTVACVGAAVQLTLLWTEADVINDFALLMGWLSLILLNAKD